MDIDKPLDAIIDQKRAERRTSRGRGGPKGGGRGGARGGRGGAAVVAAVPVVQAAGNGTGPVRNRYSGNIAAARGAGVVSPTTASPAAAVPLMADGSKIIVSNLPQDVTENQIRDLFTQTVGPVTRIQVSYDKNGKSTGVAHIDLKRAGDAQVAFSSYNARLVDGSKPMKVEIVFDPTRLPPPPLNSRIAPAPVVAAVPVMANTAIVASGKVPSAGRGAARGGRGGRGRGAGRGRGGKREGDRPAVTEQDLDAEMEDYQKNLTVA